MAAGGAANTRIAATVEVTRSGVREWRARFAGERLAKFGRVRAGRAVGVSR